MDGIGILILILLVVGLVSFFISRVVYKSLLKKNNDNAKAVGIITFILSFVVIAIGLFLLLIYNIRISR